MKRLGAVLAMALMLASAGAQAEIPDYILDQEYQGCVGKSAADPDHVAYCGCVRDGMRGWDDQSFMEVAQQAAASAANGGQGQLPAKLQDLAKACMAKTFTK